MFDSFIRSLVVFEYFVSSGQHEELKIAKEVEAHEKKIRRELEKQDMLKRKVPTFLILNSFKIFFFPFM